MHLYALLRPLHTTKFKSPHRRKWRQRASHSPSPLRPPQKPTLRTQGDRRREKAPPSAETKVPPQPPCVLSLLFALILLGYAKARLVLLLLVVVRGGVGGDAMCGVCLRVPGGRREEGLRMGCSCGRCCMLGVPSSPPCPKYFLYFVFAAGRQQNLSLLLAICSNVGESLAWLATRERRGMRDRERVNICYTRIPLPLWWW